MTLRARRIIYLTFIFLFLIITPIVILYTAGYRYNFQKHKIQKTGVLILKSKPEGARIYLDNKLKKTTTPAKITDLLPGDFSIKIEKDDFYPWQKILPIQSNLTTFAENILLFKKSLPTKLMNDEINFFSLSPDEKKMVYLLNQEAGREIWLLDLGTSQKILLYRLSDTDIENLNPEWSKDGQKILITLPAIDKESEKPKYLVLDSRTQEATVYSSLNEFYPEFKNLNNKLFDTAELNNLTLINSPPQFIITLDKINQDLTVINANSNFINFQTKAESATILEEKQKILYLKNFEIWVYDLISGQETLITRYGKEIKKALWINENYILILIENTLKAIELDERGERNIIDFVTLEKIDDFDIDNREQKIYFIGTIGNKKGVYELPY